MNTELLDSLPSESPELRSAETVDLKQLSQDDLCRVLDLVCLDSGSSPERYLRDTTVPYGGE